VPLAVRQGLNLLALLVTKSTSAPLLLCLPSPCAAWTSCAACRPARSACRWRCPSRCSCTLAASPQTAVTASSASECRSRSEALWLPPPPARSCPRAPWAARRGAQPPGGVQAREGWNFLPCLATGAHHLWISTKTKNTNQASCLAAQSCQALFLYALQTVSCQTIVPPSPLKLKK
jgi:hypothetical protein